MDGKKISVVKERIDKFLTKPNFLGLLQFVKDCKNKKLVKDEGLDITSTLCTYLREHDELLLDEDHFSDCEDILLHIAENGNSKEVLVGLLESADCFICNEMFHLLLMPIQKVLMLIPGKRGKSLDWVLGILNSHLVSMSLQGNYNLEDEELLLLDLDVSVRRISESLMFYMKFLNPFIDEVSNDSLKKNIVCYRDRIQQQREILQKYLLRLLARPLLYQDLQLRREKISLVQACCQKLLKFLCCMSKNFFSFATIFPLREPAKPVKDEDTMENYNKVPILAFANLAYLMFCENLHPDCRPYVYSQTYLFEMHFNFVVKLLQQEQYLVIYKGLELGNVLVNNLEEFSLPGQNLKFDTLVTLSKALLSISTNCEVNRYRFQSTKLFETYVKKFTWKSRYRHIMCIMNSVANDSIQGFVIGLYKNFLHSAIADGHESYFIKRNLSAFFREALHLDNGVETDVLQNYHKIIHGMNMFLYLVLRDKKSENLTGIWDLVDDLVETFVNPLQKAIDFSRVHLMLEQDELLEENKRKKKKDINATVKIKNELLPMLPSDYKSHIISQGLNSFDMLENVLVRLKEVLQ